MVLQLLSNKYFIFCKKPVDFTSTTNLEFLYFDAKFLAMSNPILSEKISLPFSSTTPHLSPSPSKPKPISALFSLTTFAMREAFLNFQD